MKFCKTREVILTFSPSPELADFDVKTTVKHYYHRTKYLNLHTDDMRAFDKFIALSFYDNMVVVPESHRLVVEPTDEDISELSVTWGYDEVCIISLPPEDRSDEELSGDEESSDELKDMNEILQELNGQNLPPLRMKVLWDPPVQLKSCLKAAFSKS